jgi:hypothetical protein
MSNNSLNINKNQRKPIEPLMKSSGSGHHHHHHHHQQQHASSSSTATSSSLSSSSSSSASLLSSSSSFHGQSSRLLGDKVESKLYANTSIEGRDNVELCLEDAFNKLQHLINDTINNNNNTPITEYAGQSKGHYDEVCNAILFSILTDPTNSAKSLRVIFQSTNFNATSTETSSLIANILSIITENYSRMLDTPRQQLVWLIRELVKARAVHFEKVLLQMLRNIITGNCSEKNIWLAESMLDILSDEIECVYGYIELLTQSLYTYLRIISDHLQSPTLQQLRQRECDYCLQLMHEKWAECSLIGRDLIRLLQNLSRLPEFEQLWRDMTCEWTRPQTGLMAIMRLPTRRRCLISRLTFDMERKIYFLCTSVKFGMQRRYLEWFQRQYLNTPESQSLRIDIIRYLLVVLHPTNEQLNSGLTPRWAICAWLINTCTNSIDVANLKLALFYDWLVYDNKKDNIMFIEPGILLMYNTMRINNPTSATMFTPSGLSAVVAGNTNNNNNNNSTMNVSLTSMLFDFLCRIATNYFWPMRDVIQQGISNSFKDSVDKRVIPSMQVFFPPIDKIEKSGDNSKFIDKDLRSFIQTTFSSVINPSIVGVGVYPNNSNNTSLNSTPPPPLIVTKQQQQQQQQQVEVNKSRPNHHQLIKNELMDEDSNDSKVGADSAISSSLSTSELSNSSSINWTNIKSSHQINDEDSNQMIKIETDFDTIDDQITSMEVNNNNNNDHSDSNQSEVNSKLDSIDTILSNSTTGQIQSQLAKFLKRPFKIFSSDQSSNNNNNTNTNETTNQSIIDNHLGLIFEFISFSRLDYFFELKILFF